MNKDTTRPEKALALAKELKALIVADDKDGRNVDFLFKEICHIEEDYQSWLADIKAWNAKQVPLVKPIQTEKTSQVRRNKQNAELETA